VQAEGSKGYMFSQVPRLGENKNGDPTPKGVRIDIVFAEPFDVSQVEHASQYVSNGSMTQPSHLLHQHHECKLARCQKSKSWVQADCKQRAGSQK
jgi:hypothetical protein